MTLFPRLTTLCFQVHSLCLAGKRPVRRLWLCCCYRLCYLGTKLIGMHPFSCLARSSLGGLHCTSWCHVIFAYCSLVLSATHPFECSRDPRTVCHSCSFFHFICAGAHNTPLHWSCFFPLSCCRSCCELFMDLCWSSHTALSLTITIIYTNLSSPYRLHSLEVAFLLFCVFSTCPSMFSRAHTI